MTSSLVVLDRNEIISTNYSNILELIIVNATVNFLPSNLPEIFPNLKRLEVVNSSLLEINFNDLFYPKLSALVLSHNKIKKIDEIFLNDNLKILRLDHNEISEISSNAFDDLENLQELKLDGNLCITEDEPNVKKLIKEVKIKCSKAKMSFLLDLEKVDATSMTVIVVIILLLIAILVAIFVRLRMEKYDYEVKEPKIEMDDFNVTCDMPNVSFEFYFI